MQRQTQDSHLPRCRVRVEATRPHPVRLRWLIGLHTCESLTLRLPRFEADHHMAGAYERRHGDYGVMTLALWIT